MITRIICSKKLNISCFLPEKIIWSKQRRPSPKRFSCFQQGTSPKINKEASCMTDLKTHAKFTYLSQSELERRALPLWFILSFRVFKTNWVMTNSKNIFWDWASTVKVCLRSPACFGTAPSSSNYRSALWSGTADEVQATLEAVFIDHPLGQHPLCLVEFLHDLAQSYLCWPILGMKSLIRTFLHSKARTKRQLEHVRLSLRAPVAQHNVEKPTLNSIDIQSDLIKKLTQRMQWLTMILKLMLKNWKLRYWRIWKKRSGVWNWNWRNWNWKLGRLQHLQLVPTALHPACGRW